MGMFHELAGSLMGDGSGTGGMHPSLLAGLAEMFAGQGGPGFQGLVGLFHRAGLADVVNSWVSTGPNLPISPEQVSGALGHDLVAQLAERAGLSKGETADQLSRFLPGLIDRLTPGGTAPEGGLDDLLSFLKGSRSGGASTP
jgi:uncharacterized protein YidB (DUF937 family)